MEFEMDFDYTDDSIEEFFTNKLKLLRNLIKTEESVTRSFEAKISDILKNKLPHKKQSQAKKSWKYVFEYKFILGFEFDLGAFINEETTDLNIILEFKPATSPLYKIEKYKLNTSVIAVLVIDNVDFTKNREYSLKGVITCSDTINELVIEEVVKESDFYDRTLSLKDCYSTENPHGFLSFLALNNEIVLNCKTSKSYFQNLFNIKTVQVDTTIYYLLQDEMLSIDGSIFKLSQDKIHLFYRSKNHLIILLHYLFKNVKDFNIDLNFKNDACEDMDGDNEDLKKDLVKLISTVFHFHKSVIGKNCSALVLNEEYKVCRELLLKYEDNLMLKFNS